jgi:ABC-type phosphate/phosphonate transport system substrate-binding protein
MRAQLTPPSARNFRLLFAPVSRRDGGLVFASYLAPNIRPTYQFVVDRVGEALGRPTRLVTGKSLEQLREGSVDFAFLCGLPYVRLHRESPAPVEAIAAPVVQGRRYGGRPIYFSDVIVSRESAAESFEDLRGCCWGYNEPDSHSGYLITLFRLFQMGETGSFFGRCVMTGFHQKSIRLVAAGRLDASAVDSQVLSVEMREHPELADRIRVIGTLGPSSIQPLVATRFAPESVRSEVCQIVTGLGRAGGERAGLDQGLIEKFVPVDDARYADIGEMLAAVETAGLSLA